MLSPYIWKNDGNFGSVDSKFVVRLLRYASELIATVLQNNYAFTPPYLLEVEDESSITFQ